MFDRKILFVLVAVFAMLMLLAAQCGAPAEPEVIVQTVIVEKEGEKVVETVVVEVEKEVVTTVEVEKEVVTTVEVEVVKEVEVAAEEEMAIPLEEFTNANIDWQGPAKAAGEDTIHLTVAMNKHPFTESLVPLIPIFEELTGIEVHYEILPEMEYWAKLQVDQSSGGGFLDVFMTGPELGWQSIPPGWVEPLDDYINNPELTDLEWWDQDDFYEPAWKANKWDGVTLGHGGYGEGPVYAIPVTFEIMSITYRKDLFDEAGIQVDENWPQTWEDVYDACKATTKDTDGDGEIDQFGIISRGAAGWNSHFGGYSNIFYSYGATDLDEDMMPALASERGIEATELWAKMMQDCAPPGLIDLQWFQAKQAFAAGQAAMIIDCEWFAAATYEHPDRSEVAGKLGYALTPEGPDGLRVEDLWFWSLGLNPNGFHKDAAWLFVEWATSKPALLRATVDYQNWNPSRHSVWEHPDTVAISEPWGDGAYRAITEENRKYAKIPHAVNPYVFTTHEMWWRNVQDIILGNVTAEEGLKTAEGEMYEVLAEGGVYD